jgi:hypothetical protein
VAAGNAVLDFGVNPTDVASVAITGQAAIVAGSQCEAWFMRSATATNGLDEHEEAAALCKLVCGNIVPGVGFTVYAHCLAMLGVDQFTIQWVWL